MLLPWLLILLSWGVLGIAFLTHQNTLIDHDYLLRTSHLPWLLALMIFLLCWQIMTLAMMLPATFSHLLLLHAPRRSLWRAQAIFIIGYASIWTGFAFLAFLGDTVIHQVVQRWWWLYLHAQLIGALTLAFAGIYQWSPLKKRCLALTCEQTRAETSRSSLQQGIQYGMRCVGSNLALMLIMFGIGMKNLTSMIVLTAVMFLEREIHNSRWLRPLIGVLCLLAALCWYLFP
jgi:predicted metal-binding membrane protein